MEIGYPKNGGAEYLEDKNWGTPDDGNWHVVSIAHHAPQQPAPVPPQKPKLRVGQVWRTRGGDVVEVVEIKSKTTNPKYPFRCVLAGRTWTVTKDGRYYSEDVDSPDDLIELISDVPQEGGEA